MIRAATALTLATAVAVASPASAGRICNLVTDKPGDQVLVADGTGSYVSSDFDIRSADVAANLKYVVAVVRLGSMSRPTPQSPGARKIAVGFTVDYDRTYWLSGMVGLTEVKAWASGHGGSFQQAEISVDYGRGVVTLYAPANNFGTPPISRREVTEVRVETSQHAGLAPMTKDVGNFHHSGVMGAAVPADEAIVEREYVPGSPTCVVMPR